MSNWFERQKLEDTLATFHAVGDSLNHSILISLPSTIIKLQNVIGKQCKAVNARVNALVVCGLATREKGTGEVHITQFGLRFLSLIAETKHNIEDNHPKYKEPGT